MECAVYILYSIQLDQFYVGSSCNLEDRLYRHKNHGSKFTKKVTEPIGKWCIWKNLVIDRWQ